MPSSLFPIMFSYALDSFLPFLKCLLKQCISEFLTSCYLVWKSISTFLLTNKICLNVIVTPDIFCESSERLLDSVIRKHKFIKLKVRINISDTQISNKK